MLMPPVSRYMTIAPHAIGPRQPLAAAHRLMRDHRIRHLPVLDGDRLVGIVSQRDLHLLETLPDVDPESILVEEAMTDEVFVVSPEAPLDQVVARMADTKQGSVVVMRSDAVVGIFTTIDALRAFNDVLQRVAD